MGLPIVNIRWSQDHLIFIMGILILGKIYTLLYRSFCECAQSMRDNITLQRRLSLAGCIQKKIPALWKYTSLEKHGPLFLQWFALRFKSAAIYLDTMRECYEAYVIYNFMAYLLAYLRMKYPTLEEHLATKPEVKHFMPFCCFPTWAMGK